MYINQKFSNHFLIFSKVYIEFPMSNMKKITQKSSQKELNECQVVPGNISFGVYMSLKMHQLKYGFKIPLLK